MFHWLKIKSDLKLVAVADGARDNWEFLTELSPDVEVLELLVLFLLLNDN